MTIQNLYVDINVLQTVPSSNINRDDTGAPKTALYGGVTRSRVSSQSWKKAVRQYFKDNNIVASSRTLETPEMLAKALMALDSSLDDEAAVNKSIEVLKQSGIKNFKDNKTKALLFVSQGQIDKLASYVINNDELNAKEIKKILKGNQSLDLALFGRMVADNQELNVEGSVQVAHAISTHEIVPEFDYFTALDDEKKATGAAMLGSSEYNSATLYRYANINLNELVHNIGTTDAIDGAMTFVKQFILTMPTGKQNSYANKTIPNYVMVTIRPDTPVNLVSAFENPVKSQNGYVEESIKRLEEEYKKSEKFIEEPILTTVLGNADTTIGAEAGNLSDLLKEVTQTLTKAVQDENTDD